MSTRTIKRVLLIAVPVVVAAFALPRALAWGRHHHMRPASAAELTERLQDKVDHVLDEIDATEQQRARADALVAERAPQLYSLMSEGRELRVELKQVMLAEQLDRTKLDAVRAKIDAVARKAADTSLDAVFQLSEVLTPAQRAKIADHLARFDR